LEESPEKSQDYQLYLPEKRSRNDTEERVVYY